MVNKKYEPVVQQRVVLEKAAGHAVDWEATSLNSVVREFYGYLGSDMIGLRSPYEILKGRKT